MNLAKKHCVPCEGTEDPLTEKQISYYMQGLHKRWKVVSGKKIRAQFTFKSFPDAVAFIDAIVPIAQREGHHPDLHIYYNKVTVELWTHAISGLFKNDFIMAAKIENILT